LSRDAPITLSETVFPGTSAFVLSENSAEILSFPVALPIAFILLISAGLSSAGLLSNLKSPVKTIFPTGHLSTTATPSGIEWFILKNFA